MEGTVEPNVLFGHDTIIALPYIYTCDSLCAYEQRDKADG